MISLQQIRRFFVTMILTIMLAITIAFDFGTTSSWAGILPTQNIDQLHNQIAKMDKSIAKDGMESNSQTQEDKRFKAETLEGINESIGTSNYQPGGKTKKTEKQDRELTEDIKAEASEAMDSYSNK